MTPGEFIAAFDVIAEAPGGIERLRELVLQLAVRGKLVPQDEGDGEGEALLSLLKKARIKGEIARRIRKQKDDSTFSDRYVDIPQNWTWTRLYEIGQTQTGTSPSSNNADLFGDYIPFIKPGNMGGVEINYDGSGLSKEGIKHSRFVPANSILMVCIGATLGKVNKTTQSVCFNQQINSLTTYLDIDTLADYIVLALRFPSFQKLAWSKAGTGTLPIISKRKWEVLPIPLPPLKEQHRIVAKVDELMGLIDRLAVARCSREAVRTAARDSALAALRNASTSEDVETAWTRIAERMDDLFTAPADLVPLREAVLQLAVRGRLVSQELTDEPASVLLNRIAKAKTRRGKRIKTRKALPTIQDNMPPFEIPVSWEWTQLGEITSYGITEKAECSEVSEETWVLELQDIEKVSSRLLNRVRYGMRPFKSTKNRFCKGDILYGKLRPYLDKVVLADEDGVCSSEIMPIRGFVGLAPQFIRLVLKAPYFVQYANSSTHGMNLPRLGTDKARQALFPLPPESEQHRIVAKIDKLMGLIDRLERHLVAKEGTQEELAVAWAGRVETKMQ